MSVTQTLPAAEMFAEVSAAAADITSGITAAASAAVAAGDPAAAWTPASASCDGDPRGAAAVSELTVLKTVLNAPQGSGVSLWRGKKTVLLVELTDIFSL